MGLIAARDCITLDLKRSSLSTVGRPFLLHPVKWNCVTFLASCNEPPEFALTENRGIRHHNRSISAKRFASSSFLYKRPGVDYS